MNKTKTIKWIIATFLSFFSIAFIAVLCIHIFNPKIAQINGYPVRKQEFKIFLDEQKSGITSYYFTTSGIEDFGQQFWNSPIDGQTPMELATQRALIQCVEAITIRQMAEEIGVAQTEDYYSLYKQWKEYNNKRKIEKENKGIVYGPVELSFKDYYSQYISKLQIEIQYYWEKKEPFSEAEIIDYYNQHRNQYTVPSTQVAEEIFIESGADAFEGKQGAYEAYEALKNNLDFQQVARYYMLDSPRQYEFLGLNRKNDELEFSEILLVADSLQPGEISEPFPTGGGWSILFLRSREKEEISPLEDVRNRVISALSQQRFNQRLMLLKEQAIVKTYDNKLNALSF